MVKALAKIALALAICGLVAGCLPKLYRINIQQGNVVTESMLSKLKPNLSKEQVLYIMGPPVIKNSFNGNRWDYVHVIIRGSNPEEKTLVTLHFQEDKLIRVEGDLPPEVLGTAKY